MGITKERHTLLYLNHSEIKQAGAELGQAQPQLGLRLANVEI